MDSKAKLVAFIIMLVGISLYFTLPDDSPTSLYQEWKQKFGMKYTPQQDYYRLKIFMKNLQEINQHNSRPFITYQKGINQFTGITQEEFEAKYLTKFQQPSKVEIVSDQVEHKSNKKEKLTYIDWISYGAVSPVRDQGQCTASYAFSAIGAVEGFSVITKKVTQIYSPQQLIDCSQIKGNAGCETGTMNNCFDYIAQFGIFTEKQYPYHSKLQICSYLDKSSKYVPSKIVLYDTSNTCEGLQYHLTEGPVSVAVDGRNFKSYFDGIFSDCSNNLSLGALVVGMNDDFWNLKLSWGTNWGQAGYIRLYRGYTQLTKNTCGVCQLASRPVI